MKYNRKKADLEKQISNCDAKLADKQQKLEQKMTELQDIKDKVNFYDVAYVRFGNLTRRNWFERSQLLSWEVAMPTYLVQVVVLSVAKLAGTVARKTRRTRTSDSVVGFMQQRPSRLLGIYQQREKGMAFDVLPLS